jgi:hypothetical protein
VSNKLSRALSKNNLCLSPALLAVNPKIDLVGAVRRRKLLLEVGEEEKVVEEGEASSSQEDVEVEDDVDVVEEERARLWV